MHHVLSRRPTAIVGPGNERIGGEAGPEDVIIGCPLLEAGDEFGFGEGVNDCCILVRLNKEYSIHPQAQRSSISVLLGHSCEL